MADVQTYRHDYTLRCFQNEVVLPAVGALDSRIEALGKADYLGHEFDKADMELVRRETLLAFTLSIQSIWERQLRTYLAGCAWEFEPEAALTDKIEQADWKMLQKLFCRLRPLAISDFPMFEALDQLQLLGNACRHGNGAAATELARRWPDLWRPLFALPGMPLPTRPPPVASMDITLERLAGFVGAIGDFWAGIRYLCEEALREKPPRLVAELEAARSARPWLVCLGNAGSGSAPAP